MVFLNVLCGGDKGSCSVPFGDTRQGGAWAVWVTCLLPKQVCSSGRGWDQLASSAGPPLRIVEKIWWADAAKRRPVPPTDFAAPTKQLGPQQLADRQTPREVP